MNLFGIIGLKDIVDILLVAGLMFYIYKLMFGFCWPRSSTCSS